MPEPTADPHLLQTRRVARLTIAAGLGITLVKFTAYLLTGSVAVMGDALESIINVVTAVVMLQAIRLANRPPDQRDPYGHGNIEFLAVGLEGVLIAVAAASIAGAAVWRWSSGQQAQRLDLGLVLVGVITLLTAALAAYVWSAGRRYQNATLVADGKHLATDVLTTLGVLAALAVVRVTGWAWVDPGVAMVIAVVVGWVGVGLMKEAFDGLMSRADPEDDRLILDILQQEVDGGRIAGFHKVRHRHTGPFHWVDMHLQMNGQQTITQAHRLASEVEARIEKSLGQANATAHIDPAPPNTHKRHPDHATSAGPAASPTAGNSSAGLDPGGAGGR